MVESSCCPQVVPLRLGSHSTPERRQDGGQETGRASGAGASWRLPHRCPSGRSLQGVFRPCPGASPRRWDAKGRQAWVCRGGLPLQALLQVLPNLGSQSIHGLFIHPFRRLHP